MKNDASPTRIEALKIAQYLGCSGVHKTDAGWMPCANHQTLQRISQRAEVKNDMSMRPKRRRRRRGRMADGWENLTEKPVVAIDTLADGSLVSGSVSMKAENKGCPEATKSIPINLRNRQKAIKDADYGPLNPKQPNDRYWKKLADDWKVSVPEAKKQRCGNCAAFVKTPEMLSCIRAGIGRDKDSWSVIEAGDLGYCEFFDFKCASQRTCSAWVVGGPITESSKRDTKGLSTRLVDPNDPDVFKSPESARKRSRQMGCIGIRRLSTSSGEDVWMPCTNESDYRRSMGRSPQGRMDIAKQQVRDFRLGLGKMRQKGLGAKTPAPKKDQIKGSKRNAVGTAASRSAARETKFTEAVMRSLKNAAKKHNSRMEELNKPSWTQVDIDMLKAVYQRGAGAYSTSHRPNVTRGQWAMGRVRAYLWMMEKGKPKKLTYIGDADLLPRNHPFRQARKSAEGIALAIGMIEIEEKGLGKWIGRMRKPRSRPKRGRIGRARKRIEKPDYDGDGDGFVMNPLTGQDDLPAPPKPPQAITPEQNASLRKRFAVKPGSRKNKSKPSFKWKPTQPEPVIMSAPRNDPFDGPDEIPNPDIVPDPVSGQSWLRDDGARLVGGDWIPGKDTDRLEIVPSEIGAPLREWNGMPTTAKRIMEQLGPPSEVAGSSNADQWRAFLAQAARNAMFGFRATASDAEMPEELTPDMFLEDPWGMFRGALRPSTRFQYDYWRELRNRRKANPNVDLVEGARLSDQEMWFWAGMVLTRVRADLDEIAEQPGFDPQQGHSYDDVWEVVSNAVTNEAPGVASQIDEQLVMGIVFDLLGTDDSGEPMFINMREFGDMDEEDLIEAETAFQQDFDPSQLRPEWSSIRPGDPRWDDLPPWYRALSTAYGYPGYVAPPEVPNDRRNPNYRPYTEPGYRPIDDFGEEFLVPGGIGDVGPDSDFMTAPLGVDDFRGDGGPNSPKMQKLKNALAEDSNLLSDQYSGSPEQIAEAFIADMRAWFAAIWSAYQDVLADDIRSSMLPPPEDRTIGSLFALFGPSTIPDRLQALGLDSSIVEDGIGLFDTPILGMMSNVYLKSAILELYRIAREGE